MSDIQEWQERSSRWMAERFPDDTLLLRGLVLGEETGEVQRCIVKADQDIRGGSAHWLHELQAEAVDVFFALVSLANRAGFDLSDAIDKAWPVIEAKRFPRGVA